MIIDVVGANGVRISTTTTAAAYERRSPLSTTQGRIATFEHHHFCWAVLSTELLKRNVPTPDMNGKRRHASTAAVQRDQAPTELEEMLFVVAEAMAGTTILATGSEVGRDGELQAVNELLGRLKQRLLCKDTRGPSVCRSTSAAAWSAFRRRTAPTSTSALFFESTVMVTPFACSAAQPDR